MRTMSDIMSRIVVNRHVLPNLLAAMIEDGTWPPSASAAEAFSPAIGDTADLLFLDVTAMVLNTEGLEAAIARGDGPLHGLTSGGPHKAGLLEVESAVVIAATHGEELVALDYSGTPRRSSTDIETEQDGEGQSGQGTATIMRERNSETTRRQSVGSSILAGAAQEWTDHERARGMEYQ
jgi:hypothetical protein